MDPGVPQGLNNLLACVNVLNHFFSKQILILKPLSHTLVLLTLAILLDHMFALANSFESENTF